MPKGLKNLLTSLSESFGGRNTPNMTSMEDLGMALHEAAVRGNRRRVKRILNTGILIDYPNDTGQTALFCACFEGQAKIVELLLKKGANPNIKCKEGSTPLHAGAFSGNVCIVSQLVAYGGDLRLHDNQQRSVRKWAERQSDNKKKARMLDFLGRIRNLAMTRSGRDLVCEKQSKEFYEQLKAEESHSLMHLFKKTKSQATMSFPQSNIQSLGFGKVYLKPGDEVGAVATIPLVSESQLLHDDEGLTYNNGPFMVCESMKWDKTQLTAKRLHKCPLEGGVVDLLINEYEFMSQLRHPNILLLMGICNTNNMDGMVLLYERVSLGSLYHHIHHLSYEISPGQMLMIMTQLSDGLLFLHQHNLIHCCITSHAVHLVSESVIKLGNMEYMIHNTSHEGSAARTDVTSNRYINAAYNWMSPELMAGEQPSELSDVYSLCVVMWEIINAAVPWGGLHVEDLMSDILELGRCLPLDIDHLGRTLHAVLAAGLSQDLTVRSTVSIARIRLVISHLKKDREDRMKLGASASALNRHWGSANTSLDESHDLCTTDKNASMYSTASTNRDNTSIQATQGSRIGARPTPSPEKSLVSPEKKSGSPEKKPVEGNLTLTPSKSKNITETPKESQQESPSKLSQPDSVPLQIETKPRTSGDLKISPKKAFTSWTLQDDIEIKEMVAQAKMSPLIKAPSKVFSAPRLGAQPFPKDFVRRSLVTSINNLPPKPPRASLSKVVNEKHSEVDQAQSKGKKNK